MQLLSCHDGKLVKVDSSDLSARAPDQSFVTGLPLLDQLLPGGAWARGAMHEVLWDAPAGARPLFFAAWLASRAVAEAEGRVVWCDPRGEIYPPALAALGVSMERLFLLRPKNNADEIWALAECLGCRGVGVTVAQPPALSRVEARRLQLAAERGGGVGVLLRASAGAASAHHAAATRWLVEPAPGERTVQRWKVQLIYGHGGHLHQPIYLECARDFWRQRRDWETDRVRAVARLADRPDQAERARRAIG